MTVLEDLGALGVVPVVEIPSTDAAVPLAGALADGSLPVVEVTLRTPAAFDAIAAIAAERPDVIVGAGTVLDRASLERAATAGARFAVSPGFDRVLSATARELGLPYLPGAVTATEVQAALGAGHRILKFFPAEAAGGVPVLRALSAPFAAAGVRFVPTGGVSAANARSYLDEPAVLAVGGTWITPRRDIEAGDWDAIAQRAAQAASSRPRAAGSAPSARSARSST